MRILFVIGVGILPEQRIKRWQMAAQLYAKLGKAFQRLGHQVYYYVHPEAYHEDVPPSLSWQCEDHYHLPTILEKFEPDYVFCWNGSSAGDLTTSAIAHARGAKMVYSEQGWFPQATTLYFDMAGCNGKCGTKNRHYPKISPEEARRFLERRKMYIESIGQSNRYPVDAFRIMPPDLSKPVFLPLQDERDLNIVQDSPFRTMDEFVEVVSHRWPNLHFIVRPHPKYPNPKLRKYSNITLDNPKKPMFDTLAECGLVIGINSTTLLESALLGYTVLSFGESLATGTGLLVDVRPDLMPENLSDIRINYDEAESTLNHLLVVKQMFRDQLDNPLVLMQSSMFRDLSQHLNWNNIYR